MPPSPPPALDALDLKILGILQRDNRMPQRDIGKAVNLSAAAVHRRIRKLEANGVIVAGTAQLAPELVGHPITVIVQVSLESERLDLLEATKRSFTGAPEVQQCYYVTGDADFILILTLSSMAEYESLTRRLFFDDNNVRRFRTYVVMDRAKVGLAVPV